MSIQTATENVDDKSNSERLAWLLEHVGDGTARDLGHTQRSNIACKQACLGCNFRFSCVRGFEQTTLDD